MLSEILQLDNTSLKKLDAYKGQRFMRKNRIIALAITTFISVAAQAVEIPLQFRGQWGESSKTCNPKMVESNNLLKISDRKIEGYEIGCRLKKLKEATDVLFEGTFACDVEGETSDMQYRLDLQNGGKIILSNGNKLIRCK